MQIAPGIENSSKTLIKRQKPTLLPYSCHAQFGTSGMGNPPAGGVRTVRGIGWVGSHSSATMTQTAMRLPSGNLSGGRSVIGEYSMRSVGSHGCLGGFHGCVDFFGRLFTLELCLGVMKMQDCGGLEMWRRSFRLSVLPNCDCRAKAQGSRYNPFRRPHRRCLDRAY
jgi:hypothetical protein